MYNKYTGATIFLFMEAIFILYGQYYTRTKQQPNYRLVGDTPELLASRTVAIYTNDGC